MTSKADQAVEELLQDPEVRAAYDRQVEIIKSARQIRGWRKDTGLTQAELAEQLHIDVQAVMRMESIDHDTLVTQDMLNEIAQACGVRQ